MSVFKLRDWLYFLFEKDSMDWLVRVNNRSLIFTHYRTGQQMELMIQ